MKKKITKLLIANRSEIATRIARTAKLMNIKTVGVYSDSDANAPFIQHVDEAIALGGNKPIDTYLNIDKIIDACKKTGANALHPGYGFLSEKSHFAKKLEEEGIIFVGPSYKSMDMMGDKITSKETAKAAGVNVVPGFMGEIKNAKHAQEIAEEIGLPVIIKASAGGGGKGMKIVYTMPELLQALESAQNEARNAFNDDRVFIEKYIEKPRHIEIQIIGDKHGNIVCLGERECSIQRFNQKIIEECPSPFVKHETRMKMYDQSIKLAKAAGYYSAGTIEYIMDQDQNFCFLEMNTRLQVEHPTTEFVTDKDLVALMIKVAEGERLPFTQNDIVLRGSSIECRICAEDPAKGFIPSIGRIQYYKEPAPMHNVTMRVDSGIAEGYEIPQYYDSMIAKVITHGETRKEAIESMKKSLGQLDIEGIATNINFLEDIIRNQEFISGHLSTWFIKEQYPDGFRGAQLSGDGIKAIIAGALKVYIESQKREWSTSGKYNLTKDQDEEAVDIFMCNEKYDIRYHTEEDNKIVISFNSESIEFISYYQYGDTIVSGKFDDADVFIKIIEQTPYDMILSSSGMVEKVRIMKQHIGDYNKYMAPECIDARPKNIKAPISGTIMKIFVYENQDIVAGQELFIIEAMKMENVIRADFDSRVKRVHKCEKDSASVGELVIEFDI